MARAGQLVSTKKRKVHIRLAERPKEVAAASVYRVMQKKSSEKASLVPHCTIHSRESRPPLTRYERVRKSEKEDASNQTSPALRKVFLLGRTEDMKSPFRFSHALLKILKS